ncbi:hypothetical protein BKI52_26565 [marine bacterium AO1-C]|nr:hypothetical protein BKI52_26565 [marine bacterium AO1-C]
MKTLITALILVAIGISASSQNINGVVNSYARVTAINTGTNVVTIDNISGSIVDFDAGEKVLLIQMKGAAINGTNTASFGDITAYNNAGNYEMAAIQLLNDIGGGRYEITLDNITRSYTPGTPGGYVQVVSVPQYTNVTVNGTVTATPWNETQGIGGIVTFEVSGTLTLGASIDVSGQGFTGGAVNTTADGGCTNSLDYARDAGSGSGTHHSRKGLGITDEITNMEYGRGNLANGGGGGNTHNAGGGGGGNFTVGGIGGTGWPGAGTCAGGVANGGGLGGAALSYDPSTNKIFLGGGGGGGQQNNADATPGGTGGGIILIRTSILTSDCSGTHELIADGNAAAITTGNDGAGGGGAGGVILLEVNTYDLTCAINAHANGGNGADVDHFDAHGGGGGGGVGALLVSNAPPSPAVFGSTPGTPGTDCNTGMAACDASGNDGGTCTTCTSTGWTVPGTTIPLPIELGSFQARLAANKTVDIRWITITEKNTSHFEIEKTQDFKNIEAFTQQKAVGNSNVLQYYSAVDHYPAAGITYYRLKSVDFDGTTSYSSWKAVNYEVNDISLEMFPNPANEVVQLHFKGFKSGDVKVFIVNALGQVVLTMSTNDKSTLQIPITQLQSGVYTLQVHYQQQTYYKQLIIKR